VAEGEMSKTCRNMQIVTKKTNREGVGKVGGKRCSLPTNQKASVAKPLSSTIKTRKGGKGSWLGWGKTCKVDPMRTDSFGY